MKKYLIYLFAFTIIISSCKKDEDETSTTPPSSNEFTISASDFANVGDTFYMARDFSDLDTLSVMSTEGIWDFSGLTEDEADTNIYYDPSIFAAFSDFPDANIAFNMTQGIAFAIKTDDMIEVIGFYTNYNGMDIILPLDDHLIMYKFPMKKGDNFTDTGSGSTTTSIDYQGVPVSINITIDLNISSEIKEKAEMKLDGSSATCLSEYKVLTTHLVANAALLGDLLNQTDTMKNYNYYASGKGTTYATVELDSLNNFNNVVFLKEL